MNVLKSVDENLTDLEAIIEFAKTNNIVPQPYGKQVVRCFNEGKIEANGLTLHVIAIMLAIINEKN